MPYNTIGKQRKYYQQHKEKKRQHYQEHKDEMVEKQREYYQQHKTKIVEDARQYRNKNQKTITKKRACGSAERYNEAMLKYEGECAFACDRDAVLIHHMDGKSRHNSVKQEVNNNLKNLLPLCNFCHSWLHNWRGVGRTKQETMKGKGDASIHSKRIKRKMGYHAQRQYPG